MPPGTLGFRVTGDVRRGITTRSWCRTSARPWRPATACGRYLIEGLDNMEAGALWADTKLGVDMGVRHRDDWERSAIVTDIAWMVHTMKVFGVDGPGRDPAVPDARRLDAARGLGSPAARRVISSALAEDTPEAVRRAAGRGGPPRGSDGRRGRPRGRTARPVDAGLPAPTTHAPAGRDGVRYQSPCPRRSARQQPRRIAASVDRRLVGSAERRPTCRITKNGPWPHFAGRIVPSLSM